MSLIQGEKFKYCSLISDLIVEIARCANGFAGSVMELHVYCVIQQVLRALPAETKVDGLPRVTSAMVFH